jgi:RNA polymerase sigma factor (sigma-70 family)
MATDEAPSDLISRARAGDVAAQNALLAHCRPRLLAFVNRWLPDYLRTQVAEEIVQDAWVVAWPKFQDFKGEDLASFYAWLKQFVANKLRDWRKHTRRLKRDYQRVLDQQGLDEPDDSCPGFLERVACHEETPSKEVRRREREEALRKAMRTELTDSERVALVLRYFEGLPVSQVAAVMKRSPGYVKNLCLSGKTKLRAALGRSSEFFSSR